MSFPARVKIREVAPRDGFQSLRDFISTERKIEIINAIAETGVSDIEATSFVSPAAVPQLRDAKEVMSAVPRGKIAYSALVPNLKGAQNAVTAGADELLVVISATEDHNLANLRRTVAESLTDLDGIFELAKGSRVGVNGAIAVAFGCPYQGDVPERQVLKIAETYASRGANRIILADTTGMALPTNVVRMVKSFQAEFPVLELGLHFHNNRGTAMANLYAALNEGVSTFDTALGGIGGCPYVPQASGNLATEDVVYMLEEMGVRTGIDLVAAINAARFLERSLGYVLPGQVMKSGPRDPRLAKQFINNGHC